MEEDKIEQAVLKETLAEIEACGKSSRTPADACVICLETVSERAKATPCKHDNFDFLCLVSWLQERQTCPLCKTEVVSVDYDWQTSNDHKTYIVPRHAHPGQAIASSPSSPPRRTNTGQYLHTSRRPRRTSRPKPRVSADAALIRRKEIYARGLYSLHVGTNRLSRFRELNPPLFSRDQELISRARKWIRRELQVFDFLQIDGAEEEGVTRRANNAEFLLEYIVAILKTVDIKGSGGQAEDMLQEFLGRENTQLFLHELKAWLRSPYTSLEDWDRHVQYPVTSSRNIESVNNRSPLGYARRDSSQSDSGTTHTFNRSLTSSSSRKPLKADRYRPYPNVPLPPRERR